MSRIGKRPIEIPSGTEVSVKEGTFTVKGPKGTLSRYFKPAVSINIADKEITLSPADDSIASRALWGTYSSHISNMVKGVNEIYEKKLIIEGVGYKAEVKGKDLVLAVGFSHPVALPMPEELNVSVEKNVITISGIDKELVGHFTAKVRSYKKPEPYKGKGIRYEGEVIRRKEGKKTV
ncbi:MAG: 50S ribosomal protein L6 [Parcubacteria group bacterium CG11_big_fil_rev_8_21_14_0_20_39_22]|nr:MAG: 50S ribosomal protein L6 [Parcubacteria group bacterium CG11_big_fil_rev_8_21_14_0_20_39_22]